MIEISNLSKSFNDHMVLEGVGTKIEKGSICGLIGSNGAGKSTLLRCVSGVYKPQEGEVRIDGEPVYENADAKQKLFFLADEAYFPPSGIVREYPQSYRSCIQHSLQLPRHSVRVCQSGHFPLNSVHTRS